MRLTGIRHGCCNRISRARWQFPGRAPAASYLLIALCRAREKLPRGSKKKRKGTNPPRPLG